MKKILLKIFTMTLFVADVLAFFYVCYLVATANIENFYGILFMFSLALLSAPLAYFAFSLYDDDDKKKKDNNKKSSSDFSYIRKD